MGKSCILNQYVDQTYNIDYISTVGIDFKIKNLKVEDKAIKLQIWDTAG